MFYDLAMVFKQELKSFSSYYLPFSSLISSFTRFNLSKMVQSTIYVLFCPGFQAEKIRNNSPVLKFIRCSFAYI